MAASEYEDIDNQGEDNYAYDEIGNLVKDQQEGIENIEWRLDGEVARVEKTDGSTINFAYDATGNRVSKHVLGNGENSTTYYVRDASGNVMRIYQKDAQRFMLTEQPIYGSDMIGGRKVSIALGEGIGEADVKGHHVGLRQYHLKNHLGNILATVADRKGEEGNALVLSANDYYPFGMSMPGRSFNADGTRYGFNGMEKDDELKGTGNSYDFGNRIYDPRIGRWLSRDKYKVKYPSTSTYGFAMNNPIMAKDIGGDSIWVVTSKPVQFESGGKLITTVTKTLHIEIAVYDISDAPLDPNEYKIALENELKAALQKSTEKLVGNTSETFITYNVEVNVRILNTMNDVKNSDHLLVVVDDVNFGSNAVGVAKTFSKIAYAENGWLANLATLVNIGVHEEAHNFGIDEDLYKPENNPEQHMSNYMYSANDRKRSFYSEQINRIWKYAENGDLNKGKNSEVYKGKSSKNSLWHSSTMLIFRQTFYKTLYIVSAHC